MKVSDLYIPLIADLSGSDGQRKSDSKWRWPLTFPLDKGKGKVACGTLLWDVGEYRIHEHKDDADSDPESGNEDSEALDRARLNQRAAGRVDGE
jgi:hypothetical protein